MGLIKFFKNLVKKYFLVTCIIPFFTVGFSQI